MPLKVISRAGGSKDFGAPGRLGSSDDAMTT
jgi:hypothetical protein